MRVLVTGHLGYIGTVLTPMLVRAGHEVVGLDSDLYSRCTYSAGGQLYEVPTIRKDTRDASADDVAGFDAVLHLAALSNDPLGDLRPEITDEINHRASVRLAELAKRAGVRRFLFASSCSNYGLAGEEMIDETGNVPADALYSGFYMLAPTVEVAQKATLLENLWNDEFVEGFQAMATWSRDHVPFPGAAFRQLVDLLVRQNILMTGSMPLGGRQVDLARVQANVLESLGDDAAGEALLDTLGRLVRARLAEPPACKGFRRREPRGRAA